MKLVGIRPTPKTSDFTEYYLLKWRDYGSNILTFSGIVLNTWVNYCITIQRAKVK